MTLRYSFRKTYNCYDGVVVIVFILRGIIRILDMPPHGFQHQHPSSGSNVQRPRSGNMPFVLRQTVRRSAAQRIDPSQFAIPPTDATSVMINAFSVLYKENRRRQPRTIIRTMEWHRINDCRRLAEISYPTLIALAWLPASMRKRVRCKQLGAREAFQRLRMGVFLPQTDPCQRFQQHRHA